MVIRKVNVYILISMLLNLIFDNNDMYYKLDIMEESWFKEFKKNNKWKLFFKKIILFII